MELHGSTILYRESIVFFIDKVQFFYSESADPKYNSLINLKF